MIKKFFNWVAVVKMKGRFSDQELPLQEKDPVIQEMRDFAQKYGMTLRVNRVAGGVVTEDMSYNPDRVNAYMEQADGKWRVGRSFKIG